MRRFNEMNPAAVLVYYIAVIFITMFSMDPVIISLSLLSSVLCYCLYSRGGARVHLFSALLFVILALLNPLTVHNGATVLFYFNSRPITLEAALYGIAAAGMMTSALYRLRSLSHDLTVEGVLYIFGRISPKLSLLLSMTLRYVGLFKSRWHKIQDAQRALGLYDDGNIIDAVRGRLRVLSILLTWSLENGVVTAQSMDARGYGSRRRSSFRIYHFTPGDLILLLATLALTGLTVAGLLSSGFSYYPEISSKLTSPVSAIGYPAFALLSTVPIIINTKEAIKWRCLKSAL